MTREPAVINQQELARSKSSSYLEATTRAVKATGMEEAKTLWRVGS